MTEPESNRIHVDNEPTPTGGNRRRSMWIGAGAVVVTLTVMGWLPSLIREADLVAATEPTVPSPTTTTTRLISFANEPVLPPPTETSLGTMVWVKVESAPLPASTIAADPIVGGFYGYDEQGLLLRSGDGRVWQVDETSPGLPFAAPTYTFGRWGFVDTGPVQLVELVDGTWTPVSIEPDLPRTQGLSWEINAGLPADSGDLIVIPVEMWAHVAWEDVYGEIELDCPTEQSCGPSAPYTNWNPFSKVVEVKDPNTGLTIDVVIMARHGSKVEFEDPDTGAILHTVDLDDEQHAKQFMRTIHRDRVLTRHGVMTGVTTSVLEYHPTPWNQHAQVLASPEEGFVAYESLGGYDHGAKQRLWTSTDGVTWTDQGKPGFVGDTFGWAEIGRVGDHLLAGVSSIDSSTGEFFDEQQWWISVDGIAWETYQSELPPPAYITEAGFGYLATAWGNSLPGFWISPDGETWEELPAPTIKGAYSGYAVSSGAAGDLIYMITESPSGHHILWVASFTS